MPLHDAVPAILVPGIDLNVTNTDVATVNIPYQGQGYLPTRITVYGFRTRRDKNDPANATANGATATFGVFTGAGGTGTTIVANAALTGATGNTVELARTIAPTTIQTGTPWYIRIGTANGTACFADVLIEYRNYQ